MGHRKLEYPRHANISLENHEPMSRKLARSMQNRGLKLENEDGRI